MPSSITLAILATFIGVLVLGNGLPSNDIKITGRDSNKIQMILDFYSTILQSSLDRDVHTTIGEAFLIMGEAYRYEFLLKTIAMKRKVQPGYEHYSTYDQERYYSYDVEIPSSINSLKMIREKYYYNKESSSNQFYSVRTDKDGEKTIFIDRTAIPSFFDSITITYPEDKILEFGNIEIRTDELFIKYRVAHHLLEKLFFIGFNSTEAISGTLFAADLSGANASSVQAKQILKDMKVDAFVDVTVDQYTGDMLLASETGIFILHKMMYFSNVDQFATSPGTKLVEA